MRTISLKMVGWNITVPSDSDFEGRNRENKATKIEIITERESNCTYSIDISAGMASKVSAVMAVSADGVLSYTLPSSVLKNNTISFQIVGTFTDGTVMKSNVIKCKIGTSINATEAVTPAEATAFQQALSGYASNLTQAINSATSASASATSASASASASQASASASEASRVASAASASASQGYAQTASEKATQAAQKASEAVGYAERAESAVSSVESSATTASAKATQAAQSASSASASAERAKQYAENAQTPEFLTRAIYTHNQSRTAHPDIVAMIPSASTFVTKATEDLIWYYKKSQTYSKEEINELIRAVPSFSRKVVDDLPTTNISDTTIYLVRSSDPQSRNYFIEYIRVNNDWEIIGGQSIDLTSYAKKSWVQEQGYLIEHQDISGKADVGDSYTKTESDAKYLTSHQDISGKANVGDSYTKAESDGKYLTEHQSLDGYATTETTTQLNNEIEELDTLLVAIKNACEGSGASDYKISQIEELITSYLEDKNVSEVES